jgi:hypothetical protein
MSLCTIALRTGMPPGEDPWSWACGFYPGCHPNERTDGTAATFDQARVEFEDAWRVFLSNRTEADFETWREQRDWTERKYSMWQALCRRVAAMTFPDDLPLRPTL